MARPRKAKTLLVAVIAAMALVAIGALIVSSANSEGDHSEATFSGDYWKQEYGR